MFANNNPQQLTRGFSLIEIMVVVVIIGIFASFSVSIFNPDDAAGKLRQESRRLQRVFSIALDEAQIHGSQLGLIIADEGYQFLILRDNLWQPISGDKPLETHNWPEDTQVFLTLEGLATTDDERSKQFSLSNSFDSKLDRDRDSQAALDEEDDSYSFSFTLEEEEEHSAALKVRPQIYILSSGEVTPFELLLMHQGQEQDQEIYYQIRASYIGKIEIDGPFDEEPQRQE